MSIDATIRSQGIGGSEIAALVGVSPNMTAFDVYRSKVGLDAAIERTVNQRMWAGKRLERVIAEMYSETTGRPHRWHDQTMPGKRAHQVVTPDALVPIELGYAGGLDCKNVGWDQASKWGEDGSADVPDHIALQCQWYLDGCAAFGDFWDVAAFFGGNELRIFRITPDRDMQESLYAIAERFWRDHIEKKSPPPIEYSDATAEWVRRRFPRGNGHFREATQEDLSTIRAYREFRDAAYKANTEKDTWALRLKDIIGPYDGLTNGSNKPVVTGKAARDRQEIDWQSIALPLLGKLPAVERDVLIGLHTRTIPGSRRLLLKGEMNGQS